MHLAVTSTVGGSKRGIKYLLNKNLDWTEEYFTAVGFPKVFYLKYHGYAPLKTFVTKLLDTLSIAETIL